MRQSRTRNVTINAGVAIICQVINLCLNFVSRTCFIHALGAEYLGVNGLFSNVLSVLSFAELGIGNAIVFSMYKPLAHNDETRLTSLLALYKKAYTVIAIVVLAAGLVYVPFIDLSIKERPDIPENLICIYLLFLSNTVISYLVVYKKSILTADQKNYLVLGSTECTHILQIILQILVLVRYKSLIAFLIIQIVFTLLGNILCAILAEKKYPYIKNAPMPLTTDEKRTIFENIKSMAAYKFGSIILNGTDNIIVSAMLGVIPVGIVSNYVLLHQAANSILGQVAQAFTASVGNLNVVGTKEQKYDIFNKVLLITVWMYGFASAALVTMSQQLMPLWLGESYMLNNWTVVSIIAGFYVFGVHTCESNYRTTLGLFVKGRWAPICSSILNVILSIYLCTKIGLAGIFIATPISRFAFIGIVDTTLIYREAFKKNPLIYYLKNVIYLCLVIIFGIISSYSICIVTVDGWCGFIIRCIIFTVIFNSLMFVTFFKTKEFKGIVLLAKSVILH